MTRTLLLSLLAALAALAFGAAPAFAATPAAGGPVAHAAHDDPGDEPGDDVDEPDPGDDDGCTGAFVATAGAEACADDESQDGDEQQCTSDPGQGDEGDDPADDESGDAADETGEDESSDDPGDEPVGEEGEDPGDEESGDEPTAVAAHHGEEGCEAEASAPPSIARLRVAVRGRHGRALRVRFQLDRASRVRLAFERIATEARTSRRCASVSRRDHGRRGCRRSTTERFIVVRGHAGTNTATLRRWRHRLGPGSYRLTATPAGPGAESATTTFKLVAPSRRG